MKITTMAFPVISRARQFNLESQTLVCCSNYTEVFPTYTEPWRS